MSPNKKAFTLIEVLAAVLIIGILAAVAIAQHKKAVLRSRVANTIIMTKSLENADNLFYLRTGIYVAAASDINSLERRL
ncbi:MAG: prepilin-type N-terminal cleavage/methylation domain-containing protein [Elusimicrobiota bacterium]|jgi:prepilin-type N-terminal cleavage/methylation domain-containing protein|nr:prepilin-type N-terminal cleavage/methylation domain-containing protein [Elusimicrobiota bacterium]MDR0734650.1 prepilin-type N-terminal cleavage/methylation domain-containing protein [Elusimicrobiota bacterium]